LFSKDIRLSNVEMLGKGTTRESKKAEKDWNKGHRSAVIATFLPEHQLCLLIIADA